MTQALRLAGSGTLFPANSAKVTEGRYEKRERVGPLPPWCRNFTMKSGEGPSKLDGPSSTIRYSAACAIMSTDTYLRPSLPS